METGIIVEDWSSGRWINGVMHLKRDTPALEYFNALKLFGLISFIGRHRISFQICQQGGSGMMEDWNIGFECITPIFHCSNIPGAHRTTGF
jgi:hypothetical protein